MNFNWLFLFDVGGKIAIKKKLEDNWGNVNEYRPHFRWNYEILVNFHNVIMAMGLNRTLSLFLDVC